MRLKQLQVKGFKSFADKTILNFDAAITGVIGPNGCGKSNVIDAIRWVIGEQKISALRSENMEALVFNGSKKRSPSGMAEVSLVFENTRNLLPTEFSTVAITRRFYRNGDSEYRLNDVACRLKDINNLFMDTGISSDSYSMIESGMVDDIIKDRDNSRRKMLEQAAGITVYKTRKKEAKQKLDATAQDLSRIEDLLFEINNQLKTLESQAKKAEKYNEIKKDYKDISIELAKAALEGFNGTYKEVNQQQESQADLKLQLETEITSQEAAILKERNSFSDKEKALQDLQQKFNGVQGNLHVKENEKNLASQSLQYLKEKEKNIIDFLAQAEGQLNTISDSIEYSKIQVGDESGLLAELQEKIEIAKDAIEDKRALLDEKRAELDVQRQSFQQIQRQQFEAEKKVAVADTSIQNLQRSQMQLQSEKENRTAQLQNLEGELKEKETVLADKKSYLTDIQKIHEETKAIILSTQEEMEKLRASLADENRKLDAKKNEHALLKNLIDSMEGYPESIKFLHKNKDWNNEAPILSDIIYVKEEYRAAVENVLEPYLNYYVVNDLQEGMTAIQLLDNNKKGKANFFLLDKFQNFSYSESQVNNATKALDIIEVDEKYRKLAEYLLANVYIVDEGANAEASDNTILLEKSGKFVQGKYTLTGGSVGVFEGKKIGRAKNLEKLQATISKQDKLVSELKNNIEALRNKVIGYNEQLKEKEIQSIQNEINSLTNGVFITKNKVENLISAQDSSQQKLEDIEAKLEQENDAIYDTKNQLNEINSSIESINQALKLIEMTYQQAEQDYNFASVSYNDQNIQLTKQQSKINSLKQELAFKEKQLQDLVAQKEGNNKQLSESKGNIEAEEVRLQQLEKELIELFRAKEIAEKELNEADQLYYSLRNELQVKEDELRQKTKQREAIDNQLNELKDKLNELKLQLAGMKERLYVEFHVDLDEILDQDRTTTSSVDELTESSERLKKRLQNLGEVNPTAVEAYTEMKKRYEFILEQKNDLVTARESLMQTIQEVETTANQQFLETFNKVKENFQVVFKTLFTEQDTADLIMENPENLAETGIDIVAKPKGKRPSSITQLSGGEKTLTATALLFSIYLIKPAPFCILDEVDAPLDDANVGKFVQMIRKFSENSQFIIVTHNKQMMSAVDVIYGVTMQEPGVSKLVPVDFRSLKEN
ncbi:chromosome segregation protein SMC [Rhizosphaericola mali]|uniref:Chromosome partition protein Smc n=1 Tax=Rhizosphaericola mali TaxID=2545455 RepID=A0A5P2G106_9BACT|nr:chromosome segregation protein SMC [Rhizosphaericola mali]QES87789.1 chromosome segregation protein SMC [Rhizosphaericola mali]